MLYRKDRACESLSLTPWKVFNYIFSCHCENEQETLQYPDQGNHVHNHLHRETKPRENSFIKGWAAHYATPSVIRMFADIKTNTPLAAKYKIPINLVTSKPGAIVRNRTTGAHIPSGMLMTMSMANLIISYLLLALFLCNLDWFMVYRLSPESLHSWGKPGFVIIRGVIC
jgi:hypothetical protein